jgi:hypothetical protein
VTASLPVPTLRIDLAGTAFRGTPTWTDCTSDLLLGGSGQPARITWGAQDERSDPVASTLEFMLDNSADTGKLAGRWTPGHANADADWNVDCRVSFRLTRNATVYEEFDGYVESVEPTWPGGVQSWSVVKVTCVDVTARLGRQAPLNAMVIEEMLADSPTYLYPMTEPQGSTSAGDIVNPTVNPAAVLINSKYGALPVDFGHDTGMFDGLPGIGFAPNSLTSSAATALAIRYGNTVLGACIPDAAHTVECWFTTTQTAAVLGIINVQEKDSLVRALLVMQTDGKIAATWYNMSRTLVSAASYRDGLPHHVAVTQGADKKTFKLYVDGVVVDSLVNAFTNDMPGFILNEVGADSRGGGSFGGTINFMALYPSELSAARLLAHYQAGKGTLNERSDQRYARIAAYTNVPTTGLPTGLATMGGQKTAGRSVTEVLSEVAQTEGSESYATGAGELTFQVRTARYNATAGVSLTADDLSPDTALRIDRQGVMNQLTAERTGGATQTYIDATAQLADGIADGGSFTVAPSTDYDALQNAAWRVATHLAPQLRIPSVKVDLLQVSADATVQACLAAGSGTLVTITGLPSQAPSSSVSLFVEGGVTIVGLNEWSVEWFTSPNLPTTLRADAVASARTKLDNGVKIPF